MICAILLCGKPSAIIANYKGFRSLRWLVASGMIGLIVVCRLASANAQGISAEEAAARAAKGNRVGAALCWIALGLNVLFLLTPYLGPSEGY